MTIRSLTLLVFLTFLALPLSAQVTMGLSATGDPGVFADAGNSPTWLNRGNFTPGLFTTTTLASATDSRVTGRADASTTISPHYTATRPNVDIYFDAMTRPMLGAVTAGTLSGIDIMGAQGYNLILTATAATTVVVHLKLDGSIDQNGGCITVTFDQWSQNVGTAGTYNFTKALTYNLTPGVNVFPLSVYGFSQTPGTAMIIGSGYRFNFNIGLEVVPTLEFKLRGASCGGNMVAQGTPQFGKPFVLTLQGGTPNQVALLVVGNSFSQYMGLNLPFDLSPLGAPGCHLRTNIVGTIFAPIDGQGVARITLPLPPVSFAPVFPDFYLQWLHYSPGANALGILTTELGHLYKK